MKKVIYYFSGTGNWLSIAKDIQKELIECEILPITSKMNEKIIKIDSDIFGIIFPVYFLDLPRIVKKFLKKIIFLNDCYIFGIANGNGVFGKSFVHMDKILKRKKMKLNNGFYIDMPGNSIVFYDFTNSKEIRDYRLKIKTLIIKEISILIKNKIEDRSKIYCNYLKSRIDSFSIYNIVKDRTFKTTDNCKRCELCVKICPLQNIKMIKGKIKWNRNCEFCLACIHNCPEEAIQNIATKGRLRYKNPDVTIKEMFGQTNSNIENKTTYN